MSQQYEEDQKTAAALGLSLDEWLETKTRQLSRKVLDKKPGLNKKLKEEFDARMKEEAKAETKKEQRFVRIQQALRDLLNPSIQVYADELGAKVFFRIHPNNIVKHISFQSLVSLAIKELEKTSFLISSTELADHLKTWSDKVEALKSFPSSFELGGSDLTFNRIEISLTEGSTPTWDYFISKCGENGPSLMAFVWALLERKCETQQYLLLKGSGRDGKGAFTRWLDRLHGGQTVGLNALDKYWPAMCVGKRIAVFNDINKTSVVMTSAFKQITGGDKVTIEQKYEKALSIRLDTHFILTTNRSINIIDEEAERRRAILVEIENDNTFIENYEEKLHNETSAFLFKCKQAYRELYIPTTKQIKCDYSFFEAESSSFEEQNESLFKRCFEMNEKRVLPAADFATRLEQEIGADNGRIGSFKEWLKRTHGIKRTRIATQNEKRAWVYPNLVIKSK